MKDKVISTAMMALAVFIALYLFSKWEEKKAAKAIAPAPEATEEG